MFIKEKNTYLTRLAHSTITYIHKENSCSMIVPSKELEILRLSKKLKLELQENTSFSEKVFDVSGWVVFIYVFHFFMQTNAQINVSPKTFQLSCTDEKVLPKY